MVLFISLDAKCQVSPIIGKPTAPVTLIEFGDFQCEFYARFAKVTEPNINATYIQTGKANMISKHSITHGDDSVTAAVASQCANEQGQFWKFYKTVLKIKALRIQDGQTLKI
jgi:protein-disulfide isomerase